MQTAKHSKSTKADILDSALDIVREAGALSLTIDAVAERSGFSKGGVLYNFPTKDALIAAMVQRLADRFAEEIETARASHMRSKSPTLAAMVDVTEIWLRENKSIARAILVTHMKSPNLIDSFMALKKRLKDAIRAEHPDFSEALAIWCSLEGLHFADAHGVMLHTDDERTGIFANLRRRLSLT
ncbi:TetR family transcriptional regulator [Roseibium hamelinense]|uniref:TetR family transcriptional regulator n=1 Tax=Roseibium hamelinense TaxID=150831 RepID=A0A562THU1_9HYPH|nr:TetR/AcrR family transcriptional regulator [Roseibium hamelinense]MTI45615.1 TetR/AcrR family transcriptional regulator [Roseibium hamelinense]TWI93205.1 TetR family transcriptional regulator [Roseibium hamelinense]